MSSAPTDKDKVTPLPPEFLRILGNPNHPDRPPLRWEKGYLICSITGQGFPVVDGIPHMLPEDAIDAQTMQEILSQTE